MLNSLHLIGRVGQQPVLKDAGGSKVCNFTLATSRSWKSKDSDEWKEETQWHNIVIWGQAAERVSKFDQGDVLSVTGEIRYRTYEKDNQKHKVTEVFADKVIRVAKKGANAAAAAPAAAQDYSGPLSDNLDMSSGATDDLPF